jgi:hypothetical protein
MNSSIAAKRSYFGVPLAEVLKRDGTEVPLLLSRAFAFLEERHLHEEGLFRISAAKVKARSCPFHSLGTCADVSLVQVSEYIERIDEGREIDFNGERDATIVCDLVKLFFRELPEPLFTHALYESLVNNASTQIFYIIIPNKQKKSFGYVFNVLFAWMTAVFFFFALTSYMSALIPARRHCGRGNEAECIREQHRSAAAGEHSRREFPLPVFAESRREERTKQNGNRQLGPGARF